MPSADRLHSVLNAHLPKTRVESASAGSFCLCGRQHHRGRSPRAPCSRVARRHV